MTMKSHIDYLKSLSACPEAREFASNFDTLDAAWQVCERGDWMIWLIGRTVNCEPWTDGRKPLLAVALDCAETVRTLWPEEQKQVIEAAVAVLRKWITGEVSTGEAQEARRRLAYAITATDATYAAAYAATATYAADTAYAAAYAADAAAYAAANAAYAAAAADAANAAYAANYSAARKAKLKECANVVRRHYPHPPEVQ